MPGMHTAKSPTCVLRQVGSNVFMAAGSAGRKSYPAAAQQQTVQRQLVIGGKLVLLLAAERGEGKEYSCVPQNISGYSVQHIHFFFLFYNMDNGVFFG